MSWDDVKGWIGKAAPVVGTLLGGPAGGAVGGLVASALGVEEDPDKVMEALKSDPEALVKIKQLELEHAAELRRLAIQAERQRLEAETARITQVNETMRAELASGDRFKSYWRPLFGYFVAASWLLQVVAIVYVSVAEPTEAPRIINAIASTSTMWGVALAVLGVAVSQRSKDKKSLLGQPDDGLMSAITQRIRGG